MIKKQYIALVFTILLLSNNVGTNLLLSYYVFFPQNFIEKFCQNQDKPEMHCAGKCEINLLTHNSDQSPDRTSILNVFSKLLVFYNNTQTEFSSPFFVIQKEKQNSFYQNNYFFFYSENPFRPPILG